MTVTVFTSGSTTSNGTGAYVKTRIPALVKTGSTLVAFCEGRRIDNDFGDIEIIASRSTDGGTTWTGTDCIRVVDNGVATAGNPCPIVNSAGHIVLLFIKEAGSGSPLAADGSTRKFWKTVSTDAGATWSAPVALSALDDPSATWQGLGPCHGIRLRSGPHAGRLVAPFDENYAGGHSVGGVLYSDDDGATWAKGGYVDTNAAGYSIQETSVCELMSGRLLFVTRNGSFATGPDRIAYYSDDQGITWGPISDLGLTAPVAVEGPVLQHVSSPGQAVYFSTPANTSGSNRIDLTLFRSTNAGAGLPAAWDTEEYINANAAYSDLVELSANSIGILYEQGVSPQYQKIDFQVVNLSTIHQVGAATTASTPGTDATTIVVNKPSGVVSGHVLLAAITANNMTFTPPSGWTEFNNAGTSIRTHLFYKVAGDSEPSNYTFTSSGAAPILGTIAAWSGVDNGNPIAAIGTAVTNSGGAEPQTTPSVDSTTATTHGVVMHVRSSWNSANTTVLTHSITDAGFTEVADNAVLSSSTARCVAWYVDNDEFTTSGTASGLAITASGTESANVLQSFILRTALQGETAWAMDSAAVSIAAIGSDTGSGVDTATIFAVDYKSASDAGSGVDGAITPLLGAIGDDTASATDTASVLIVFPPYVGDTASAADVASVRVSGFDAAAWHESCYQGIPGIIANPERVCRIDPDPEVVSER